MIKKLFLILLAVLIGLTLYISSKPNQFKITRSITINAPAEAVFKNVNDLHNWDAWSPWAKLDPHATNAFEGSALGEGAIMRWAGNDEVGVGSMTITESHPSDTIRFKLEFLKPFAATNTAEFLFTQKGNQTEVSWSMMGANNFIAKAVSVFLDCDKMVGGQFEKGLQQLKTVSEKITE